MVAVDVSPADARARRARACAAPNVDVPARLRQRPRPVEDGERRRRSSATSSSSTSRRASVVASYLREFARVLAPGGPRVRAAAGARARAPRPRSGAPAAALAVPLAAVAEVASRPEYRGFRLTRPELARALAAAGLARGRAGREPRLAVPLRPRSVPPARAHVVATAFALAVFAVVIGAAAIAVWRRPIVALYLFVVGLARAQHRHVAALGRRRARRVARADLGVEGDPARGRRRERRPRGVRARRLPFRPGAGRRARARVRRARRSSTR